jgi:hypothetical protein
METRKEIMAKEEPISLATPRKVYEKPKLEAIGDVRSLTLGPSIGLHESGGMYMAV